MMPLHKLANCGLYLKRHEKGDFALYYRLVKTLLPGVLYLDHTPENISVNYI